MIMQLQEPAFFLKKNSRFSFNVPTLLNFFCSRMSFFFFIKRAKRLFIRIKE